MKTLYPVQIRHAAILETSLQTHRAALDNSQTGTGKTCVGAELARRLAKPTYVICPKALIPAWRRELEERGVVGTVINYEKLRTGKTPMGAWDKKLWKWSLSFNSLIIWDECQKAAGLTSQTGKMLAAAKPFSNLLLSATAMQDPTEMRAIGYILGLHKLTDFYPRWLQAHGCLPNPWGVLEFKGDRSKLAKIHAALAAEGKLSRLTTADLADHFTETQIITEPVDFGDQGEISALYAAMEDEIETLKGVMADDTQNPAAQALVAQLRARQQVELLKVPVMVEAVGEALAENRSVAIFVNFEATLQALAERLKTRCLIHGGQSPGARQEAIDAFQADEQRVIICNMAAGGVGISLHDVRGEHPRLALISPSWDAKQLLQVVGRVHRAGGKTPSQQRILFAAGTVEEKIERSLKEKMKNIETLNGEGVCNPHTMSAPMPAEPSALVTAEPAPNSVSGVCNPHTPEVDHSARAHARFSPSSLTYREICPSWENDNDPDKDQSASEEGTRCHEAAETENLQGLHEEQAMVVQMCLDYVNGLKQALVGKIYDYKEIRLSVLDQFGTVDRLLVCDTRAHLCDYKFGRRSVPDAEENAQMQAYLLGVWNKFPAVQSVEVHILLPRRDEVSRHVFTRSQDYDTVKLRIETIIARAKAGGYFNPTVKGCEFCGNKGRCPALANIALRQAAQIKLMDGEVEGTAESLGLDPSEPVEISRLLTISGILEKWAEAIRKEALRLMFMEGVAVPGYEVKQRKAPRSITSAPAAWSVVKDRVTAEDFLSTVSKVSITELEKIYAATAPRGQKEKSKGELENLLRDAGAIAQEGEVNYLKATKD